ncbi:MAG TPA: response regulator [Phenylobacterium sp.]|uniref:response regulator n=1 Tax=Phenylobacterium sp. TaxID=1871053 RepID=UPI002B5A9680|nr:response regulator [Phenylobacterium sp.]HSV03005.1 response regulator [Phenylobacterium sp.]
MDVRHHDAARDGLKILHVDDDAVSRLVMHHLLVELGHAAEAASSAAEGLARLALEPFDLIISDIHMPGLDGPGFLAQLRAGAPETAAIPVIAITADVMSRACEDYRLLGFQAVISKPLLLEPLKRLIRAATAPGAERAFAAAGFSKAG